MKIDLDVDLQPALQQLDGMAEAVALNLRKATFEGVEILREEVRLLAPRSSKEHWFYSKHSKNSDGSARKYRFMPGDLKRSVYAYRLASQSVEGEKTAYQVTWRHVAKTGQPSVPYGFMVHDGTKRGVKATRFIERAWQNKGGQISQIINQALTEAAYGKTVD